MHRADAAGGDSSAAAGNLVADIRSGEHRPLTAAVVILIEPPLDAALALSQAIAYLGVHSKTLRAAFMGRLIYPLNASKRREFSSFSCASKIVSTRVRLVED